MNNNLLPDCPVTKADIMAAEDIFGPEVGILKGKTTRRNPHTIRQEIAGVYEEEVERNKEQEEIPGVDENAQYDNEAQQLLEDAMNAKYGPCSGHYNLRSRRECDYSHLFAMNNALHSNPRTGDKRSPDHENGQDATSA